MEDFTHHALAWTRKILCNAEDRKRANLSWAEGPSNEGVPEMCDFSLQSVRSRPAKVGDKLVTRDFGTGTRGFAAADDPGLAVCVMPGTELAFAGEVACLPTGLLGWRTKIINHQTAIFRQVNKDKSAAHHDALEFLDGRTVLLRPPRKEPTADAIPGIGSSSTFVHPVPAKNSTWAVKP